MKRALLGLGLLLTLGHGMAEGEDLPASVAGQYHDPVGSYKIGSAYYLNAKQVGSLYGAQVYWYAVSGRVRISLRGRTMQLMAGSDKASLDGREVRLGAQVMLRSSHAYIPLAFLEGQDFSDWAGYDTTFNPRTKLLSVDRRSTVGPARWFSYGRFTRITLGLAKGMKYSTAKRGVSGVELNVPMGALDASDEGDVGDGIVAGYALTQNAKAAILSVRFEKRGAAFRVKELKNPRRVVLDVFEAEPFATPSVPDDNASPKVAQDGGHPAADNVDEEAVTTEPGKPVKSAGPAVIGADAQRVKRKVVIDAGHGGKDPGATGRHGTQEKDVNLAAAQELSRLLKEEGTFEVLLTRTDDTFVPLADRSRLANEFGADLFISLHSNSSPNPKEQGFEVYFLSEKATDPEAQRVADAENASLELEGKTSQDAQAELLLGELAKTENVNAASEAAVLMARDIAKRIDIPDRGVKQAGFYVLRGTHAPALLVEMAFVSNAKEEVKLESGRFRRRLVDGVYAGILDYAKRQGWLSTAEQVTGK